MPAWLATAIKYVGFGLGIALLAFLIYKLVGEALLRKNTKVDEQEQITLENLEEHIHETDLDRFLRAALAEGDYRMAVRIYYLMVIRDLSARNWIQWKKDEVNRQYLNEMSSQPLYPVFRDLTRIFEAIWYGEYSLDDQRFGELKGQFEQILKEIQPETAA